MRSDGAHVLRPGRRRIALPTGCLELLLAATLFALIVAHHPVKCQPSLSSAAATAAAAAAAAAQTSSAPGAGSDPDVREWRSHHYELENVSVRKHRLPALLGAVLAHDFTLPEVQLRKGLTYLGSNYRLRHTIRDLMTGQRPVKIGLVGGSIAWGQAADRGKDDFFTLFAKWLTTAFPKANVTTRNGAIPGTPSAYMVMCLDISVDPDVDVVFMEYVLNDGLEDRIRDNGKVAVAEKLVRRILALPRQPAVVMMQVPSHGMAFENRTAGTGWVPFHASPEDLYGALAQYYDLDVLSFRTAMYRPAVFLKQPGLRWSDVMSEGDSIHPNAKGHAVMADLAIWLFQQTAVDLALRPYHRLEAEMRREQLPPPMYSGNFQPQSATCVQQDLLPSVIAKAEGFDFVNEGTEAKPKKGYVATKAGATLKLKLNTQQTSGVAANKPVPVLIGYLKSYVHMGIAVMACDSGCSCEPKTVDAHHALKQSTIYLAMLSASQAAECIVSVTVQPKSSSGEHKFKVSALMTPGLSADGQPFVGQLGDGEWGAAPHFGQGVEQADDAKTAALIHV